MITSITIPKGSETFTIDNTNALLMRIDGIGTPPTKISKIDYPSKHGGKIISQYYDKRRLVLGGVIAQDTLTDFMTLREELSQAFSFLGEEKTIQLTTSDGKQLQFDAIAISELRITQEPGTITSASWEIELELEDPIIYSQTEHSGTAYVAVVGGGTPIPLTIPVDLSGGVTGDLTVTNNGNAAVFPSSVRLYGPGTNFVIQNNTTIEAIQLNTTLSDGEYVDLDFKNRTAYKNGSTNVYGHINGTWWQIQPGSNQIVLVVQSGDNENTRAEISWRDGYWGI